jgi:hypothetical protein
VPLAAEAYADDASNAQEGGLVAFFAAQTSETTQERGFDDLPTQTCSEST